MFLRVVRLNPRSIISFCGKRESLLSKVGMKRVHCHNTVAGDPVMETYDVGKILARVGSILVILAGFVQIGEWAIYVVGDIINYGQVYFWPIFVVVAGVIAVIFGFLLLFFFLPMVDKNRVMGAVLILIFAIVGAVFAFEWAIIGGVGAVLCLVAAILFFIEAEGGGA